MFVGCGGTRYCVVAVMQDVLLETAVKARCLFVFLCVCVWFFTLLRWWKTCGCRHVYWAHARRTADMCISTAVDKQDRFFCAGVFVCLFFFFEGGGRRAAADGVGCTANAEASAGGGHEEDQGHVVASRPPRHAIGSIGAGETLPHPFFLPWRLFSFSYSPQRRKNRAISITPKYVCMTRKP